MRFYFLCSTALCMSLVAANPVEPRQNSDDIGPGDLLFTALCSEKYVLCETRLGPAAKNFCCRNGNACSQNGTLISCADGTVARPYQTSLFPSFAHFVETASPAAYTSFVAGVTGNPFVPATLLAQITGEYNPNATAADDGEGAASGLRTPGTGTGSLVAIFGVWAVAAAGGAAWLFI